MPGDCTVSILLQYNQRRISQQKGENAQLIHPKLTKRTQNPPRTVSQAWRPPSAARQEAAASPPNWGRWQDHSLPPAPRDQGWPSCSTCLGLGGGSCEPERGVGRESALARDL